MSRKERRLLKFKKASTPSKVEASIPSAFEEAPLWAKILFIAFPILLMAFSIYGFMRDISVSDKDLKTLNVTLKAAPTYVKKNGRGSSAYINIRANGYPCNFNIYSLKFEATNTNGVYTELFKNDRISLRLLNDDYEELKSDPESDDDISVYGLSKAGTSYIDLNLVNKFNEEDNHYTLLGVLFALSILPYIFLRKEPKMDLRTVVFIIVVVFSIVLYLIHKT
ncbi:MAG: hypothetical protein PSX81_08090 [bacterium]|nr:hypothetical protein [bacterium]